VLTEELVQVSSGVDGEARAGEQLFYLVLLLFWCVVFGFFLSQRSTAWGCCKGGRMGVDKCICKGMKNVYVAFLQ
jgi:hypothetical protein